MNDADQPQIVKGLYQLHTSMAASKQALRVRRASVPTSSSYAIHAARSCRGVHREK